MPKALDLTNEKFGKLTAIKKVESRNKKAFWLCECECGGFLEVSTDHLRRGTTKSCGCERKKAKQTSGEAVTNFRQRIKIALVGANNGKCAICGIKDSVVIYDFHHLNPKMKSFGLASSVTTRSKQAYADEAKKCAMLCSNCHRKVEIGLLEGSNLKVIFDEQLYFKILEELVKK